MKHPYKTPNVDVKTLKEIITVDVPKTQTLHISLRKKQIATKVWKTSEEIEFKIIVGTFLISISYDSSFFTC